MTPTLTKREQERIAVCRQNHSGQVRDLLDIIDRLTAAAEVGSANNASEDWAKAQKAYAAAEVGVEIPEATGCKIEDNFICPAEWTESDKVAYTQWLARMPEDHPSKKDSRPWDRTAT